MFALILSIILTTTNQSTVVPAEKIKSAVMEYVIGNHAGDSVYVEWRSIPGDVISKSSFLRLEVLPSNQSKLKGNVVVPVRIIFEDNSERTIIISLKVRVFQQVLVTTNQLEKHQKMSTSYVRFITKEFTFLPDDLLFDLDYLSGKRTKRMIGKDVELYKNMFEDVPVINSGDEIRLCVKSGGVFVATKAIAKEDGKIGGKILVKKKNGSDRFRGIVRDAETVIVETE